MNEVKLSLEAISQTSIGLIVIDIGTAEIDLILHSEGVDQIGSDVVIDLIASNQTSRQTGAETGISAFGIHEISSCTNIEIQFAGRLNRRISVYSVAVGLGRYGSVGIQIDPASAETLVETSLFALILARTSPTLLKL